MPPQQPQITLQLAIKLHSSIPPAFALAANTTGYFNTAVGYSSLALNTIGTYNSALGVSSLGANTTGNSNTAIGEAALTANTTGNNNTALGYSALGLNTTASQSVAVGYQALARSTAGQTTAVGTLAGAALTTGTGNTAIGFNTLSTETTGTTSTAVGYNALAKSNGGIANNAFGYEALFNCTTGLNNTALGDFTLTALTVSQNNVAVGHGALMDFNNTTITGNNTAVGVSAGTTLLTGTNNIFVGYNAGSNCVAAESENIYIGDPGVVGEAQTIRIGQTSCTGVLCNQTACYIAGIEQATVLHQAAVFMDPATNQLGLNLSSRRLKKDIEPMECQTSKLMELRPVTFKYINDQTETNRYGMIAEEVAPVYPEVVCFDRNGEIITIDYNAFIPMLIKQIQSQEMRLQECEQKMAKVMRVLEKMAR